MSNEIKSPAELKAKARETKSIFVNLLLASMMIGLALVSTFFEFESFSSKIVLASVIIVATLLGAVLLVRWLKSLDEYEKGINAEASMFALYSSLFYLPLQYISEIGLIPEIHVGIFFMYLWFMYLCKLIYAHQKG